PLHASPITATYRIAAPSRAFHPRDDCTYVIHLIANQVADTTGNFVPANSIASFHININDTTPPTAALTPIPAISSGGGLDCTFSITYTDSVALSIPSLGNGDILVTGPHNFSQQATLLSIDDSTNGSPRFATYKFTAPGR